MNESTVLERQLELVHELHRRTREGRIDWEPTQQEGAFMWSKSITFAIRIRKTFDPDYPDQPDYFLDVIDWPSERTIETISNITLRPVANRITEDGLTPYQVLGEMYDLARRKALRVDDALEAILNSLRGQE